MRAKKQKQTEPQILWETLVHAMGRALNHWQEFKGADRRLLDAVDSACEAYQPWPAAARKAKPKLIRRRGGRS